MSPLTVIIPFSLAPAVFAHDLDKDLPQSLPALSQLLSRSRRGFDRTFDADETSLALPHERWLGQTSATLAMQRFGYHAQAQTGTWFILTPCHIQIARDHLVLTDHRQLTLNDRQAQQLFDAMAPLFDDAGHTLLYGNESTWFVRADAWASLITSTPDAACGHPIDACLRQPDAKAWRRLHNEVQMLWHTHPLNEAHRVNGLPPVNALWLWGKATNQRPPPLEIQHEWLVLEDLISPSLACDWGRWRQALQAMENTHFTPLLHALQQGQRHHITWILSDERRLRVFVTTRGTLRKFWVRKTLNALCPIDH